MFCPHTYVYTYIHIYERCGKVLNLTRMYSKTVWSLGQIWQVGQPWNFSAPLHIEHIHIAKVSNDGCFFQYKLILKIFKSSTLNFYSSYNAFSSPRNDHI